jgi:aspartyl-tRNA(Asn)/glutamyl-tRNA(Gln) amidotransferase subunit A
MTIREMGRLLRAGKTSSVELVEEALHGAETIGKELNAFITIDQDRAFELAAERDRELAAGMDRGPLHGIPTAHKDLFYTRGLKTTGGSLTFRDFVPGYDATAVEKLRIAGAVSIGKTNLHELAYGVTSKNPHYGFVHNARDPDRIPGGSSGGSATSIAAGILAFSLGTDTGGSIRIPASYCGVAGLKPTYGRVSRYGVLALAASFDHVGPLGSCVEDCALVLSAIAGHDPNDPSSSREPVGDYTAKHEARLDGLLVGVPRNFFFERIDAEVAAAVRKAIDGMERLGASVREVTVPDPEALNAIHRVIQLSEVSALYHNERDPARFDAATWNLLEQGRLIAATEYVNAQRLRTIFRRDYDALWRQVHVLATPTTPVTAPLISATTVDINISNTGGETEDLRMASTRLMRTANTLGDPALSLPCGKSRSGLPIGLQLIGRPFSEAFLLKLGRSVEGR